MNSRVFSPAPALGVVILRLKTEEGGMVGSLPQCPSHIFRMTGWNYEMIDGKP
jgi:hypothetical protein